MRDADRLALLDAALLDAGIVAEVERPLAALTTYRVGGPAARFVAVADLSQLTALARAVSTVAGCPILVVGRGSNLLVSDEGVDGLVVQLVGGFDQVEVDAERWRLVAGGGASLPVVARRSVAAGCRGFEWAVGVPGSVGGAVRMNAGGHGSDMAAVLASVRVVDLATGEDDEVPAAALDLAYRHSALTSSQVVVAATLQLAAGDVARGEAELAEIVRWRREHQPGGPNAGSVFTNPPGDSAGRLIDEAGCKGLRVGTAVVSEKHANFIQADPGGRAADVLALMAEVQRRVRDRSGVELRPETCLAGFGVRP